MKLLTALFLLIAVSAFGANPDYKVFRGAGGITIVSNPPTGTIIIDGSGVVASGTNSSIQVSTNGAAASVMATNVNFTAGNNAVLKGTNIGSTAHLNIGVASNISFTTTAGNTYLLGSFGADSVTHGVSFGFWDVTVNDELVLWVNGSGDMQSSRTLVAPDATFNVLPGSGSILAVDAGGTTFRTNAGSASVAPPISSVQFNSNGVMQGSSGFVFNNGNVGIGTAAPSSSLDVTGQVRAASAIFTNMVGSGDHVAVNSFGQLLRTNITGGSGMSILASNFFAMGISNIVSAATAGIVIRTNAGSLTISNSAAAGGFSVSGNSNQIPFLNVAGTGFLFNSHDKSAPGFGMVNRANGNIGALLIHVDENEDIGLVQIGPPNPSANISTFVPSMSITNRYAGDGQTTQEMVRVNYVDVDGGSSAESFIQTWRSWVSGTPPASTLVSYAAALRKDGQLMLAHGTYYPSNSLANTMPTAAQLGAGGFWTGISNAPNTSGTLVTVYSLNGSTTVMKVLAP